MRKQSRRVVKTKKEIETAYLELLEQKPQGKITVKEVCERAMVNRTTFYKYYEDADFLGETVRKNMLETIEKLFRESIPDAKADAFEFISRIIGTMYHDSCFRKLPVLMKEEKFEHQFGLLLNTYYYIPRYGNDMAGENWMRSTFVYRGICGLIRAWIDEGMEIPPEKLSNSAIEYTRKVFGGK